MAVEVVSLSVHWFPGSQKHDQRKAPHKSSYSPRLLVFLTMRSLFIISFLLCLLSIQALSQDVASSGQGGLRLLGKYGLLPTAERNIVSKVIRNTVDRISHFLNCSTSDEEPEKKPPKDKPPPSDAGSGTDGDGGGSGTGGSGGGSDGSGGTGGDSGSGGNGGDGTGGSSSGTNSDGSGGNNGDSSSGGSSSGGTTSKITDENGANTNGPNDKKKAGVMGLIGGAVVVGAVAVAAALRKVSG
jgi:hypothetical protein